MPQPCKVCTNPNRFEIDRLVAEGLPKRAIARRFGLLRGSLDRHSSVHLLPDVVRAAERSRLANAGTCQQIARRILDRALEGVDEARGPDGIAKLVQAATNAARLLGQVTGEIRRDPLMVFFQQVGVRDEAELRQIVEAHRQASAVTIEQCEADGVELLLWVIAREPDRRVEILAALSASATLGRALPTS